MITPEFYGGKVCKNCGLYYSKEWHRLENGTYLCKHCYEDYIVDFYANLEIKRKVKFPLVAQLVRALV